MLKHATICRTKRAQQALNGHWEPATSPGPDNDLIEALRSVANIDGFSLDASRSKPTETDKSQDIFSSLTSGHWPSSSRSALITNSCSSSPTPSLQSTTISRIGSLSSAPSSVFNSPSKSRPSTGAITKCTPTSTIKVYAQTLGQEVEYLTLPVNAQTQSRHIIRALLKKFRLKHRDPNLFYLTLERWIRKDGLRYKSVMLLAEDACPLQLQQCCSNPPHNDIKFTLQIKAGALVKIFCQDVCPNTRYKCLSLSAQTTVTETIELMLYCLDLVNDKGNITQTRPDTNSSLTSQRRLANSPDSASSSASSTSSSSGIESDPTNNLTSYNVPLGNQNISNCRSLDTSSRTGSIASISSASDILNGTSGRSLNEAYCLLIECENTNYRRVLEPDEYLVDVYQNLLDEVSEQPAMQALNETQERDKTSIKSVHSASSQSSMRPQPDQWFVIKLKRRAELSHQSLKFTNPRQNMPLPPIPLSLAKTNNTKHIQNFVSTTQIEVNNQQHRHTSSLATITIAAHKAAIEGENGFSKAASSGSIKPMQCHQRHMSAIVNSNSGNNEVQPPPARLIWMPQVKPRRRNLTNASTTFGAQNMGASNGTACNRRRYDPAQLAEDLNQLDLASTNSIESMVENAAPSFNETVE